MTKISLNTTEKNSDDANNGEKSEPEDFSVTTSDNVKTGESQENLEKEALTELTAEEQRINMDEILASVGLDCRSDESEIEAGKALPLLSMDWKNIARTCYFQVIMTLISQFVLLATAILEEVQLVSHWLNFMMWTLFLVFTAAAGYKGAHRRSYSWLIGYCIMSCFQVMVHFVSMAYFFAVFVDGFMKMYKNSQTDFKKLTRGEETTTFMVTVTYLETTVTGLFGIYFCCTGFGRLMTTIENRIVAQEQKSMGDNKSEVTEESFVEGIKNFFLSA